jgi:ABC-2 type transport system ATP-binding protein
MRQRLGIAQAVLNDPEVLVLDEPVSSLDPEGRRDLLALIEGLRGGPTVIVSTHVLADVERVCDRIAILDRGQLVAAGPLEELLAAHARPIYRLDPAPGQADAVATLVERLGTAGWAGEVTSEPGGRVRVAVTDPVAASEAILPLVVACGVVLTTFEQVRPTLEDVFLELVGPPAPDELDGRGFVRWREVIKE